MYRTPGGAAQKYRFQTPVFKPAASCLLCGHTRPGDGRAHRRCGPRWCVVVGSASTTINEAVVQEELRRTTQQRATGVCSAQTSRIVCRLSIGYWGAGSGGGRGLRRRVCCWLLCQAVPSRPGASYKHALGTWHLVRRSPVPPWSVVSGPGRDAPRLVQRCVCPPPGRFGTGQCPFN
jgi:hypothetical protein